MIQFKWLSKAPLKAYPITVDSLEAERERLGKHTFQGSEKEPLTAMSTVIKMAVAAVEDESPAEFSQMESSLRRVAGEPEPAGRVAAMYTENVIEQVGGVAASEIEGSALNRTPLEVVRGEFTDRDESHGGLREVSVHDVEGPQDWRSRVLNMKISKSTAAKTMDSAFATKVEKHVAVQALALLSGDTKVLKDWQWPVWRDIKRAEYPLSGKERFPRGGTPKAINTDMHRLLVATIPVMVKLFSGRYSLKYLQKKLGLNSQQLQKARVPLVWDKGLLSRSGFDLYKDRIRKHRFSAYNISGLGEELFFDGSRRELYIDESYYVRRPPSHLFHRVLGLLWSIKLQYFVPLSLDVAQQITPALLHIREHVDAKGLDKLKQILGTEGQDLGKLLGAVDRNVLRTLYAKVDRISEPEVRQLVQDMQMHVYRLLVAETLDVVGLFESITNEDLLATNLEPRQIISRSQYIAGLLEFLTQIKF